MSRRCNNPQCFVDEQESCALGHLRLEDCPHASGAALVAITESENERTTPPAEDTPLPTGVPWSGPAFGISDLPQLTARSNVLQLAVIGPHDAGKTTLLTGTYLMLLRGERLYDTGFAGSRTLEAWESLAAWLRFDDPLRSPTFPPHTSRGAGRVPGLLHLALRREGRLRDVLLSDAPGEWFTEWALQADSPGADGARWLAWWADGFLLVADCERLTGPERGTARQDLRSIIERLGNYRERRPVVLVWAKADHTPPPGIRRAISEALHQHAPDAIEIESRIDQPRTLLAAVERLVEACWHPPRAARIVPAITAPQPFAAFRGHS